MLYCNEHHQLLLLPTVNHTTTPEPQLSKMNIASGTLSPTISMSSLISTTTTTTATTTTTTTTQTTTSTTTTNSSLSTIALKHVLRLKRSSLYKPRKHDLLFDHIDTLNFVDEMSMNNSISTSSIPSLEFDKPLTAFNQKSNLLTFYEIEENEHPLYVEEENEKKEVSEEPLHHNPLNIHKELSFFGFIKSKIAKLVESRMEPDITEIIRKINRNYITINETTQLETFRTTLTPIKIYDELILTPTNNHLKPRECRINPTFLKFFAIYKSIQSNSLDKASDSTVEYYYNEFTKSKYLNIDVFLNNLNVGDLEMRNSIKFNILSRDKMYTNIILSPRKDIYQNRNIQTTTKCNYQKTEDDEFTAIDGSLIREHGKVMPWHNLQTAKNRKCFSPVGVLPNNTQYTAKNWENKRWSRLSI